MQILNLGSFRILSNRGMSRGAGLRMHQFILSPELWIRQWSGHAGLRPVADHPGGGSPPTADPHDAKRAGALAAQAMKGRRAALSRAFPARP